jgi:transposase-like protein
MHVCWMIVALGINSDGRKTVLGLREGATENATVVSELLSDLASRGLDFGVPRLYLLDGGKALAAAVCRLAGEAAFIQYSAFLASLTPALVSRWHNESARFPRVGL